MENIKIYHVDAFTSVAFGGNPAGVVPEANSLCSDQMQKIAKELNLSETAFLTPSDHDDADFRIRFFTPSNEIDFCGHATLGSTWVLVTEYGWSDQNVIRFETNIGIIELDISSQNLMMTQVTPKVRNMEIDLETLSSLVGLTVEDIDLTYPIRLGYTGNWHLLIPVRTREAIDRAVPNLEQLRAHNVEANICTTHLFTFDSQEKDCLLYTRDFAPAVGIAEDPVTGSANGALAGYLVLEGIHKPSELDHFTIAQGHCMGRPGYVQVQTFSKNGSAIVKIGGQAVTIIIGQLQVY